MKILDLLICLVCLSGASFVCKYLLYSDINVPDAIFYSFSGAITLYIQNNWS